jgi:hypothetical protein
VRAVPYNFEVRRLDVGDLQSDVDSPSRDIQNYVQGCRVHNNRQVISKLRLFNPITGPHFDPRTGTEPLDGTGGGDVDRRRQVLTSREAGQIWGIICGFGAGLEISW